MVGFFWAAGDVDRGNDETASENEPYTGCLAFDEEAGLESSREGNEEPIASKECHWIGVGEAIPDGEGDG